MLLEHKRYLSFGHGCTRHHMFVEQERNYGVGTDALVAVCSWNTNGIVVGAWNGIYALVAVCSWNKNVFTV